MKLSKLVTFIGGFYIFGGIIVLLSLILEKAQYNPSLKLAIDISRVVKAPIEDIFIFD